MFTRCENGHHCYSEYEPLQITIINTPPIIKDPKSNLVDMFDGLTETLTFISYDAEKSNSMVFKQKSPAIPWVTITN